MSETLTRILKEHGQVWKRTHHSVAAAFAKSSQKFDKLRTQAQAGEIDLAYLDEAGSAQVHPNRRAWTARDEQHSIKAPRGKADALNCQRRPEGAFPEWQLWSKVHQPESRVRPWAEATELSQADKALLRLCLSWWLTSRGNFANQDGRGRHGVPQMRKSGPAMGPSDRLVLGDRQTPRVLTILVAVFHGPAPCVPDRAPGEGLGFVARPAHLRQVTHEIRAVTAIGEDVLDLQHELRDLA